MRFDVFHVAFFDAPLKFVGKLLSIALRRDDVDLGAGVLLGVMFQSRKLIRLLLGVTFQSTFQLAVGFVVGFWVGTLSRKLIRCGKPIRCGELVTVPEPCGGPFQQTFIDFLVGVPECMCESAGGQNQS